jgi:hypothetical protein
MDLYEQRKDFHDASTHGHARPTSNEEEHQTALHGQLWNDNLDWMMNEYGNSVDFKDSDHPIDPINKNKFSTFALILLSTVFLTLISSRL